MVFLDPTKKGLRYPNIKIKTSLLLQLKLTITSFHQSHQHHLSLQSAANNLCSCSSIICLFAHHCCWSSAHHSSLLQPCQVIKLCSIRCCCHQLVMSSSLCHQLRSSRSMHQVCIIIINKIFQTSRSDHVFTVIFQGSHASSSLCSSQGIEVHHHSMHNHH